MRIATLAAEIKGEEEAKNRILDEFLNFFLRVLVRWQDEDIFYSPLAELNWDKKGESWAISVSVRASFVRSELDVRKEL